MSATTRTFATMLNEYLPNSLLKEELIKRDWVLSNIEKDDGWLTGSGISSTGLVVPFRAAGASSVSFGSLTGSTDIAEDSFVRGVVNAPKEVWGSMIFNHRDLMEHEQLSEQNFLRLLPDTLKDFMSYMKNVVSTNLLNGAHFAKLTADGGTGSITVDRPDRFNIGQKLVLKDDDSATSAAAYVTAINMNTSVVSISATRGGAATFNATAYSLAQNAKVYSDGADPTSGNAFSSIRGALLSSANGGDSTLYGQTKTSYPYLQGINVDGSAAGLAVNASNILEKIFDALVTVKQLGKGNPTKVVMSYKNFGSCLKVLENQKGGFNVVPADNKQKAAIQFGWMEVNIMAVTGSVLSLVGVQECDDDIIHILDMSALKFYSNGFFRKRSSPSGNEYFEVRNTTGYQYIVDVCLFGELVVARPSYCGIIFGISY